jgi:hypothetical protein
VRLARDHVSLRASGEVWTAGPSGGRPTAGSLTAGWRSTRAATDPRWLARAGMASASAEAPFDLWPGAGTGHARAPLLRAHPLLRDGVVQGPVFGRRLAHGTLEYQHPLFRSLPGRVHLAGFADAARAWRRADGSASPLHVDVGIGVRLAVPGIGGSARIDVARGVRDGGTALSVGWLTSAW